MKSPLDLGEWLAFEEVESTQLEAAKHLSNADPIGVIFTDNQTAGRGRFGRVWHSKKGDSLTMSLAMKDYADHPAPYLVGMAIACAAASALHCELAWPNDLVFGGRKVGGILTELLPDEKGRSVPVVGIGVNLNQRSFPDDISERATSLAIYRGGSYDPEAVGRSIIARFPNLPEPGTWDDLKDIWMLFDHTPGKIYRLPDGTESVAIGVGPDGRLICAVNGESTSVLAAEAIFGVPASS